MNIRTTVILFGLLIVGLGTFAAFQFFGVKTGEERTERDKWLLPTLKIKKVAAGDFTTVVVDRARADGQRERLEFKKQGDAWRMVSPKDARVDANAVDKLINELVGAERPKQEKDAPKPAEVGLDQPAATVTLTLDPKKAEEIKGPASYTVAVGSKTGPKDPVIYVNSSESKNPVPLSRSRLGQVFAAVEDFRSKELLGSGLGGLTEFQLTKGAQNLRFKKGDDTHWRFEEPKLGGADGRTIEDLANSLAIIRVEKNDDFVADGVTESAKLAEYGLGSKPDTASVTITRRSIDDPAKTTSETLLVGKMDPKSGQRASTFSGASLAVNLFALNAMTPALLSPVTPWLAAVKTDSEAQAYLQELGGYYAKLGNESSVVRIAAKHLKSLEKKEDDFRSRNVALFNIQKVDAVNLTAAGETLRFRRPTLKVEGSDASAPAEWDLYTDTRARVKTHLATVNGLITAIREAELKDATAFLDSATKERAWFGMDTIDLGLSNPQTVTTVEVWLESIQRDEKTGKPIGDGEPRLKDPKPHLKLTFGRKDDKRNVVYVKREALNEQPTVLAVPDPYEKKAPPPPPGHPPFPMSGEKISITQKLSGGYLTFRDHVLPSFKADDAAEITYVRGDGTYEVKKEEKTDDLGRKVPSWQMTKPVEAKAGDMNRVLLNWLTSLNADKLLTDRASPRDLQEKFGLDKPLLKITVTVPDKDKKSSTYTYSIGKQTDATGPNPNHFYTRVEAKPADGSTPDANDFVFLTPWAVVQALDTELRDTAIFPFESKLKPEELTLTWRKLDGGKLVETKLVLTHAPDKEGSVARAWQVKSLTVDGKDAKSELPKLDAAKLDYLMGLSFGRAGEARINPLNTPRFVLHQGNPAEFKHGLDPASKDNPPALVIEVKFDDKTTTRTLTLGDRWDLTGKDATHPGLAPHTYYHATASTTPNAVFLLKEDDFKNLASGFGYFKAGDKVSAILHLSAVPSRTSPKRQPENENRLLPTTRKARIRAFALPFLFTSSVSRNRRSP